MTDITRLISSLKRRSAHAKEFGHDVLFVKLEDIDALVEALEAATGGEPVVWMAIYHGEVSDDAIGITRSIVEAQAERFGWEPALTEIIPLYRHAQPATVVPDNLAKAFISAIEKEQDRLSDEDYLMDSRDCIDVIREELERLNADMLAVASQEAK
ncbi:TPA: hypothetical protein QHL93_002557 [Klebsiella aerogenes]|nr:hypothetical protein [Klebsiella aerogenes]